MQRRASSALAAAIAVGTLILGGCTAVEVEATAADVEDDVIEVDEETIDPRADYAQPVTTVWDASARIVGDIAVGEEVVVGYTFDDDDQFGLSAWRLSDGEQLWHRRVAMGSDSLGYSASATVITVGDRDITGYIDRQGQLTALDARTGEVLDDGQVELDRPSRPWGCDDALCLRAIPVGEDHFDIYRFDPFGEGITAYAKDLTPDDARLLGRHVFATHDRGPEEVEMLGAVDDEGGVLWTTPYAEVFGEHATSDNGWSWEEHDDTVIGIGRGLGPEVDRAAEAREPYAVSVGTTSRMVALERQTGEVRWSIDGATWCPDPIPASPHDGVLLVCHVVAGDVEVWWDEDGIYQDDWSAVEGQISAVDIVTGDSLWSREVPGEFIGRAGESAFASGPSTILLESDGELTAIDRRTGTEVALSNGVVACVEKRASIWFGNDDPHEWHTGFDAYPCDPTGAAVDAFSLGAARAAGYAADDLYIVPTRDGLQAVRSRVA